MFGDIFLIVLAIAAAGVIIACICTFGDVVMTLFWSFISILIIPVSVIILICLIITLINELKK